MSTKVILGSANFDQKYGIRKNSIKKNDIKKLLNIAVKNKIKLIDTSPSYNESEKIIGKLNNKRFQVISKIAKLPKNTKKSEIKKKMTKNVLISLKKLKIKRFECLLLHNAESLLGKNGQEIYLSLKDIKKSGLTKKIGLSIYNYTKLNKIINKYKIDLIQAPLNIFDQRLITTGWLKKLKQKKIEVHARSIFLQGTLLLKKNEIPKKLKKFNKEWSYWDSWIKKNKLNRLHTCVQFVLNQSRLNGIVLACDNISQFKEILKIKKKNFLTPQFNIKNIKLIDPRKWNN
jgi:aryl-alcohol dehydrogenase-like predicted oxidoreductase